MKFQLRKRKLKFRQLGYRKEIIPIVEKAMADFLLRISINSSYVVLGIYDIAAEGFYKHNIAEFLDQIPDHLSFPLEFSPYLKPYVSDKFRNIIYSDSHELIIGSFFRYYFTRLPALVYHGRYIDWPKERGASEGNLEGIMSYSFARFETYFPTAAKKLVRAGPEDYDSIFYQYAVGKEMADKYKLKDDKMRQFLYQNDEIWQDIVEFLPEMKVHDQGKKESWNIFSFFEMVFDSNFGRFWDSYRSDYMDTLRDWNITGAFEGDERHTSPRMEFWADLEKRIDRHEFILRTSEPY